MAASQKKTKTIIIGGGLTGLIIAAHLETQGSDYLLVESQGELGGFLRGQEEHGISLDYGLKSIPAGEAVFENPLLKLKNALNLEFQIESWKDAALVYEKEGFVDFVGFGEIKNRHLFEELAYYTQSPRLLVAGGWGRLVQELAQKLSSKRVFTKAVVTKINTHEGRVTDVIVNGELTLVAENFIFTASPSFVRELLPSNSLNTKNQQRLGRTTPLTAINLDLATKIPATDAKNIFLFKDQGKDGADPFYVVGQFVSNIDPVRTTAALHVSSWMTLVDPEELTDDENSSKIIRQMKKLIKKAFPTLVDEAAWERLLVVPAALAHFEHLQFDKNGTPPGFANLWLVGGQTYFSSHKGLRHISQAIESAFQVLPHLEAKDNPPLMDHISLNGLKTDTSSEA